MATGASTEETGQEGKLKMGRLRIVEVSFTATAFSDGREPRSIPAGEALVFLRRDEEGWTFFAKVDDIPERQPEPPQRLPEYLVSTTTFVNSTRLPQ